MTSWELNDFIKNLIILTNFVQQNLKKNIEELKNIAEESVKFNKKQDVYNEFTVKDKIISYKHNNELKEIKNWDEYLDFLREVNDKNIASVGNFIQKNKLDETPLDETPWYKKVWVWLLIVLTILFVRYSMIKVKK